MATLLQKIDTFIEKISVSDRQEENIQGSIRNLTTCLTRSESGLHVGEIFTNGSYERDTILTPLDDIDTFAVLKRKEWEENGMLPKPQKVLSKMKDYLNKQNDYKDKVKQDRPCVTIELSNKDFDVLPSFEDLGAYLIPNYDLNGWTYSNPIALTRDLNTANQKNNYKLKPLIRAVKYWNRENNKLIPSYHIEEAAINIFSVNGFVNLEVGIRTWFDQAEYYLKRELFKSPQDYESAINKVKKVKQKLNDAKKLLDEKKEQDAVEIWSKIFVSAFPAHDPEDAKKVSKALSEGTLKISSSGTISFTNGNSIPGSKGFYGKE